MCASVEMIKQSEIAFGELARSNQRVTEQLEQKDAEIARLSFEANAGRQAEAEANEEIKVLRAALKVGLEALEDVGEHLEIYLGRLGVCGQGDGKDHKADEDSWGGSTALSGAREAIQAIKTALKE